jgi:hypothetical protein
MMILRDGEEVWVQTKQETRREQLQNELCSATDARRIGKINRAIKELTWQISQMNSPAYTLVLGKEDEI